MKKYSILFFFLVMACQIGGMAMADSPMVVNPGTWHTYQRIDGGMNWNDAKAYCESMSAHLATVTSNAEFTFILDTANYLTTANVYIWLGGTDEVVEKDWQWVTGEPWFYAPWSVGAVPDNINENSLTYLHNGLWYDRVSSEANAFLCEWDAHYQVYASYDLPTGVIHIPLFMTGTGDAYWLDLSISTEDIVDFGPFLYGAGQE